MRYLLCLALVACSSPTPRNLVCERVAILSPEARCQPELSGTGALDTHTARVTLASQGSADKPATVVCGLNAGQLSMACSTLEATAKQESK